MADLYISEQVSEGLLPVVRLECSVISGGGGRRRRGEKGVDCE
jgi:hypothetical protein